MTWFKVDDGFYDHPKIQRLPLTARGLWVTAGSYAARHLTDGFVPVEMLKVFGARTRDAQALVDAGLWLARLQPQPSQTPARLQPDSSHSAAPTTSDFAPADSHPKGKVIGYEFHEWEDWQPTKEQVRADRQATRDRQSAWRERKRNGVTNASRNGVTNGVTNAAPTRPVPTIPSLPPADTTRHAAASGGTRETPTSPRQLAADLLDVPFTDPRLDHLPVVLKGVRTPGPWLRATAAAGDLEDLVNAAAESSRDPWAHLPRLDDPPGA